MHNTGGRERVSAVALVPLTLWFIASIIAHAGSDYAAFIAWLRMPLTDVLMILLLIALFHHAALGLQVVIEDYVHSGARFAAVIAVRLGLLRVRRRGYPRNTSYRSGSVDDLTRDSVPKRVQQSSNPRLNRE